jgi:putative N6-adenine-specific DNA methylase
MYKLIAKTIEGAEQLLFDELTTLGASNCTIIRRAVAFEGTLETLYKVNLHARTALRVLLQLDEFKVHSEDELYQHIYQFDWQQYLQPDNTIAVDAVIQSDNFRHSHYAALKVKDAIADNMRNATGKRPSVDTEYPDLQIHIHIHQDTCHLSLDSSGESLHRRGYRPRGGKAPLSEVLAATMLGLAGYNGTQNIVIPMCGSGTLAAEALLIARNIPACYFRRRFGFQSWRNYDPLLFRRLHDEAGNQIKPLTHTIETFDLDPISVRNTQNNLRNALFNPVHIARADFFNHIPRSETGIVILNPPYGERLERTGIENFYQQLGDELKKNYKNFDAWVLSANHEAMKHLGLRTSQRLHLLNGSLECRYYKYPCY